MLSSQVYVVVGTQIIFPGVHFSHAIVMKHIIHFIIFAQCTLHFFCLDNHADEFDGEWYHVTFQGGEVCDGQILVEDISGL